VQSGKLQSSIRDDRGGISEAVRSLDPRLSLTIGLVYSAVVAYYVPSVIIALTGIWVNNLTMLVPFLMTATILIVQNLIGNRLNKVFLLGIVFAAILDCCQITVMFHTTDHPTWHNYWMTYFLLTTASLLNAGLFLQFKKMVLN